MISHDRYLLDRLADRLLIVDDGQVREYPGRYGEWVAGLSDWERAV